MQPEQSRSQQPVPYRLEAYDEVTWYFPLADVLATVPPRISEVRGFVNLGNAKRKHSALHRFRADNSS